MDQYLDMCLNKVTSKFNCKRKRDQKYYLNKNEMFYEFK